MPNFHSQRAPVTTPVHERLAPAKSVECAGLERIGGFAFARKIPSITIAQRWVVTAQDGTARTAYRLHERPAPRAMAQLRDLIGREAPHMIPIDEIIIDETRHVWLITPYLGDWSGMLSLEEALVAKGGQLPVLEATRAITHIRAALDSSQTLGVALPNLTIDQLILCPRGTLAVELPGVAEILESPGEASTPMRWVQADRKSVV